MAPEPMAPEELNAFAAAAPECERSPLWVLLDWSLWGAGMADVFREPLASTMIAAVPTEVRAQAELLMAEWLKLRGVDSPSKINAGLRAEVARLNAANERLADECGVQCREAAARTLRAEARAALLAEFADSVRCAQPRSSHNELDQGWNACLESIQDGLTSAVLAALDVAPETPRPPAEEAAPEVSTAGGSTGVPEPEKAAQASDDEPECPLSTRVDGLLHNWVFAGAGYIVCSFCDQMEDGLKGRVIRPGRRSLPVPSTEEASDA